MATCARGTLGPRSRHFALAPCRRHRHEHGAEDARGSRVWLSFRMGLGGCRYANPPFKPTQTPLSDSQQRSLLHPPCAQLVVRQGWGCPCRGPKIGRQQPGPCTGWCVACRAKPEPWSSFWLLMGPCAFLAHGGAQVTIVGFGKSRTPLPPYAKYWAHPAAPSHVGGGVRGVRGIGLHCTTVLSHRAPRRCITGLQSLAVLSGSAYVHTQSLCHHRHV